jgi:hypothetical protein
MSVFCMGMAAGVYDRYDSTAGLSFGLSSSLLSQRIEEEVIPDTQRYPHRTREHGRTHVATS